MIVSKSRQAQRRDLSPIQKVQNKLNFNETENFGNVEQTLFFTYLNNQEKARKQGQQSIHYKDPEKDDITKINFIHSHSVQNINSHLINHSITDDFSKSDFHLQLKHQELQNIPLISQV